MQKHTWIWVGVLIVLIGGGLLYRHLAQDVDPRGATRLMRALEDNDLTKTRQLLESGIDIHARDKSGQTALFYAAHYANDPLLLHKLVVAGADTLAKDKQGFTPLMTAAKYNSSPRIVMTLARYGRFLEGQNANKNQALMVASQYNNAPIIKALLVAGANPTESDANGRNTADLLANNQQLSEQEKVDLRHIMLVLEVLEARAKFRRGNYPQPAEKREEDSSVASAKKEPALPATVASKNPSTTLIYPPDQPVYLPQAEEVGIPTPLH